MGSQPRQGDEHLTYALLWNMAHLPYFIYNFISPAYVVAQHKSKKEKNLANGKKTNTINKKYSQTNWTSQRNIWHTLPTDINSAVRGCCVLTADAGSAWCESRGVDVGWRSRQRSCQSHSEASQEGKLNFCVTFSARVLLIWLLWYMFTVDFHW